MSEVVAWWTPAAWKEAPAPERWSQMQQRAAAAAAESGPYFCSYSDEMQDAGYRLRHSFGTTEEVGLEIWRGDDDAMIVLDDVSGEITTFFIENKNLPAFVVDKLPTMLAGFEMAQIRSTMTDLNKFVLAFIRHGHGERTVSSHGYTLDEHRAHQEKVERRKREKRAAADAAADAEKARSGA